MKPISLGITGGIGSGKSVVSKILLMQGIPVYNCDDEAKRLTVESEQIRSALKALLGEDIYTNHQLNRTKLANYLFSSTSHVLQINGIIHPVVKEDLLHWMHLHSYSPIVGVESAILFDAGVDKMVDHVVMVDAPLEVRIARAMERDHADRQSIERRIHKQMRSELVKSKSGFVIVNDNNVPVIPQVLSLISSLSEIF